MFTPMYKFSLKSHPPITSKQKTCGTQPVVSNQAVTNENCTQAGPHVAHSYFLHLKLGWFSIKIDAQTKQTDVCIVSTK